MTRGRSGVTGTSANVSADVRQKTLIFVTYSCVIFAISSPLASYPAMEKDVPGFGVSSSFFVLGVATAGTGLGKLLPGYFVARFGARRTYFCAHTNAWTSLWSSVDLQQCWGHRHGQFCIEFHCRPCVAVAQRDGPGPLRYRRARRKGIQTISLASRSSDMVGKAMYGSMFYVGISWRWVAS